MNPVSQSPLDWQDSPRLLTCELPWDVLLSELQATKIAAAKKNDAPAPQTSLVMVLPLLEIPEALESLEVERQR
jgi:hypothetical protein